MVAGVEKIVTSSRRLVKSPRVVKSVQSDSKLKFVGQSFQRKIPRGRMLANRTELTE